MPRDLDRPRRACARPGRAPTPGPALAAILAALLLAGCHQLLPGSARCSTRGGAEWREYRSLHFILDTNLDRADATVLLGELERIQALVNVALVGTPREIPGYVRVVAPASDGTFREIAPGSARGYYTSSSLGEPMIVMHPGALRTDPQIIAHELAHHFTWYHFPRQPPWFTEGLAQFVQTVASDTPGYGRAAGLVPSGVARHLRALAPIPARRILSWRGGEVGDREPLELQTWSWLLYHWLWNHRPKQLADFQARLARAEDPERAWRAAFPDLDPGRRDNALAALDAALDQHRRRGELVFYQVHAEADLRFSSAVLSAAEVHLLLLDARRNREGPSRWSERDDLVPRSVARNEVGAALKDDPANSVARAMRARLRGWPVVPILRDAVSRHPGDWRAWLLLGAALEGGGDAAEREAAYRRAASLNPHSAPAQTGLAWALAVEGRAEEALPFARRAVDLTPSSPLALAALARVAADLGSCEDALALASRAGDLVGEREDAAEARRRLRHAAERCGAAEAPQDAAPTAAAGAAR